MKRHFPKTTPPKSIYEVKIEWDYKKEHALQKFPTFKRLFDQWIKHKTSSKKIKHQWEGNSLVVFNNVSQGLLGYIMRKVEEINRSVSYGYIKKLQITSS